MDFSNVQYIEWCSFCNKQEAGGSLRYFIEDEDGCEKHEIDLPICEDCLDYARVHGKVE